MSNRKSKENKFFLFSYRIHMTPKRPDHKSVEKWEPDTFQCGRKRVPLIAVGSRHQTGAMCLVLQGTPGAI